jgi:hypothetical protein
MKMRIKTSEAGAGHRRFLENHKVAQAQKCEKEE